MRRMYFWHVIQLEAMAQERSDEVVITRSLSCRDILEFQQSSWYPRFKDVAFKCKIIRPLGGEFRKYLEADGIFVPKGSEDQAAYSLLSDDSDSEGHPGDSSDSSDVSPSFAFPELDAEIRSAIQEFGAVFPKLNFTSPRDAAWAISDPAPLKCTTPADVYVLLKSSDFINHDIDPRLVFEDCHDLGSTDIPYELELVLKKWYNVERSREFRCFVRDANLIAVTQRDKYNFYEFLGDLSTRAAIRRCIQSFWSEHIKSSWFTDSYSFDLILSRDFSRGYLVDFNPFHTKTDPLLFSYEELEQLPSTQDGYLPPLRIIESRSDPRINRSTPAHFHNMVPYDVLRFQTEHSTEEWLNALQVTQRNGQDQS